MRYLFGGVNNMTDPRSFPVVKGAMADQVCADNFDISKRLAGRRRLGRTQVSGLATAAHSGWGDGKQAYFVQSSALKRVIAGTSITATTIKTFTSNARTCFCPVNNVVLCSNGMEIGIIEGGAWFDLNASDRTFKRALSPANHLCFYRGRVYGALGDVITVSDPYSAETEDVRLSKIPVPGNIGMLMDVDGGIWLSTAREIIFLSGTGPEDFTYNVKANFPAIPYAYTSDRADRMGLEFPGKVAVFGTTQGICLGTSDGTLLNLSAGKVSYNFGASGAVMVRERDGNVFAVLSTGATESANNHYAAKSIALTTTN